MSEIAEFARTVHESNCENNTRSLEEVSVAAKHEKLFDIRAVVCDVYGTLVNYWRDEFSEPQRKQNFILDVFSKVSDCFGMAPSLGCINPSDSPEKTLFDFYHGLIALRHEQAEAKGDQFPEIRIEEIWAVIVTMLKRHGYEPPVATGENEGDLSRRMAWYYNFHALGRGLYPGVVETLDALKRQNMVIGLLSNGQFYTPLDITLMLRDQGREKYEDVFELFDIDLSFFSYEYLVAKPGELLFRRLFDALYEYQILPSQTVFVGNDLLNDIAPAQEAGMKTALFTGDRQSLFLHDREGMVIPDISFERWTDLLEKVSFYAEGQG